MINNHSYISFSTKLVYTFATERPQLNSNLRKRRCKKDFFRPVVTSSYSKNQANVKNGNITIKDSIFMTDGSRCLKTT